MPTTYYLLPTTYYLLGELHLIIRQLLDALMAMQNVGVYHGHLIPENLVMTQTGVWKIADFGLVSVLRGQNSGKDLYGHEESILPGVINGALLGHQSDLWSLGYTICTVLHGLPPTSQVLLDIQADDKYPTPDITSPHVKQFSHLILLHATSETYSEQLLECRWFVTESGKEAHIKPTTRKLVKATHRLMDFLTQSRLRLPGYYFVLTTDGLLLTTYYLLLLTTYNLLDTTYYLLLTTHYVPICLTPPFRQEEKHVYLLLTTYHLPLTTYYLLLTTYYLLLTTYYLLLTTYHLLLTTYYLLFTTCYSLLTSYY